jgi:hypothetical protein
MLVSILFFSHREVISEVICEVMCEVMCEATRNRWYH